jgi:PKD repeat protein
MKQFYFCILITVLSLNHAVGQCMLSPISLAQRVNNSAILIKGNVISQKSFWNDSKNYIYTANLISIEQTLKGSLFAPFVEIITEGGEMDLTKQVVEPSLQLKVGQEGVFALNFSNHQSQFSYVTTQAYADGQGFIKFNVDENKAHEPFKIYSTINGELKSELENILRKSLPDLIENSSTQKVSSAVSISAVTGVSPLSIAAGTSSVITITGSGFGATQGAGFVEFENADDGGSTLIKPHSSQYLSWNNTQIQVMAPTRASTVCGTAGTGQIKITPAVGAATLSAQTLTVTYGHLNIHNTTNNNIANTRHHSQNGLGGMTWNMFTGFDANTLAKNSFVRAFQTWRCGTYINWSLGAPVSTNTIALDGVNVIRFDIGGELPVGVLGRCSSYFSACPSGTVLNVFVSELDIVFDDAPSFPWQYGPALATGSQMDFESVALHELGHGHQLSHVIDNADVMHWSIGPASNKRVLQTNNLGGGNAVMARNLSGAVCGLVTMTALNAGNCTVSAPTASFTLPSSVCAGNNVPLADLSSGSPTTWSWTISGGSPSISNTQNLNTTYATAGLYTVSLVAANGLGASAALSKTINVIALPNVTVTSANICSGNSATLTAGGATSYIWNPGSLSGATQVLNPTSTTVYNVVGAASGCTNNASATINVTASPFVSASISSSIICAGESSTINPLGATNYTISPGNILGVAVVSPAASTTYTIDGESSGCFGSTTAVISVVVCAGLNSNNFANNLNAYPNPVKNMLMIDFKANLAVGVIAYNSLGEVVYTCQTSGSSAKIDVSLFASGLYIIRLTSGSETAVIKLIKE